MATSRNRRTQPVEATTPETDTPVEPDETPVSPAPEAPATDESPKTDIEAPAGDESDTTDEPEIPALPDDFTPEHPLVARLYETVKQAEEHKDDPTPIADFVAAADNLFSVATGFEVVAKAQEVEGGLEFANETLGRMRLFTDFLRDHVETVNRVDGDNLAGALNQLVSVPMNGLAETDMAAIPILFARWQTSKPKGAKGAKGTGTPRTGESDIPFLSYPDGRGLRVRYTCTQCGKKFSTRKDNLNSARREIIKHMVRSHPAQNNPAKWAEGAESYKAVTNGFFVTGLADGTKKPNTDELVDSITRGDWRFEREAA